MKLAVIGTGYVGLVAGACFADMGNQVVCVDSDAKKLELLEKGIIPVYEPGLEELVSENKKDGRLTFSDDLDSAVKNSQVVFIAVGTPQNEDGTANLDCVYSVVKNIAECMNEYKVIVDKSTVPVGTASKLTELIKSITNVPFDIVSNPEFLKQGNAVEDFLSPDRVIIGSDSERATEIMKEVYSPFFKLSDRMIFMDVKSAELAKYAANSFLAMKISFINEIANLCEEVGANVDNVRKGLISDTRIGNKFLYPGIGYGGSCFPKDIKALIKTGNDYNLSMDIIKAVDKVNKRQRELFIKKIKSRLGENLKDKNIAIWGLSFKPKTNDMREAPSITIVNSLLNSGAKITAYDPKAKETAKNIWKSKINYAEDSYSALKKADCLVLLTEWNEFRKPDFKKIKTLLKAPLIFDGRNQYDKKLMSELGFEYYCVGKV